MMLHEDEREVLLFLNRVAADGRYERRVALLRGMFASSSSKGGRDVQLSVSHGLTPQISTPFRGGLAYVLLLRGESCTSRKGELRM